MGSEQSRTHNGNPKKFSEVEVNRILEKQKREAELKYQQQAEQYARLAARQKVESLLLRKNEGTGSNPPPTYDASMERKPSPYSFTQNDLHTVAQPTMTNLHPTPSERSNAASSATNINQTNDQTFRNANSNTNSTDTQSNKEKYSQADVDQILENQKREIEEKYRLQAEQAARSTATPPPYSSIEKSTHTVVQPAASNQLPRMYHQSKIHNATSPTESNNAASIATYNNRRNPQRFGDANSNLNFTEAQRSERKLPPSSTIKNSSHTVAQPAATNQLPNKYHETKIFHARSPSECNNAASIASNNNRTNPQKFGDANSNLNNMKAQRPPARQARHRSESRHRNKYEPAETPRVDAGDDDELNCTTCKKKYTLNIYQCARGHSSCSLCRGRLALCGVCGYPVGDLRNMPLEAYIAEKKTRCPNEQDGCRLIIKMADLEDHTKECPFQELACPLTDVFGRCRWHGKLPQIMKHFEDIHPIHLHGHVDTEMTATASESQIVHLVLIGSYHFLFHMKVCERQSKLYMTVQLIGTKHSAGKWTYEIHVYNKSEPRRKYQYTDICHSASTPLTQIFSDESCATLPVNYVYTFLSNEKCLNYKFYIKKESKYPIRRR